MPHDTRRDRLGRARRPEQDATTFKPLDPASPTVLLQVRVPRALLDRVDAAAHAAGVGAAVRRDVRSGGDSVNSRRSTVQERGMWAAEAVAAADALMAELDRRRDAELQEARDA